MRRDRGGPLGRLTDAARPLAAALMLAVAASSAPRLAEADTQPGGYSVRHDDPEMNAAIAKAVATVDPFIDRLSELEAAGDFHAVKFPLSDRGNVEHLRINRPQFRNGHFAGSLASQPISLKRWSYGDEIEVSPGEITDWIAIADDTLYGGFTLHVLNRRLPPQDRQAAQEPPGVPIPDRVTLWD